ncbi:MAG: 4-hydroxy-tetrahydrodipicolinate synthase [Planctomycetes bacterium]|nr:4-hydroxy-tetrahydrodipicolinate synthase [Planctomycetota bacterium]
MIVPRGFGTALATPFAADGDLDLPALAGLTRHVVDGGADFLVALGSTGEAAMLTDDERDRVVTTVCEHAGGLPLLVGTGASATAQAVRWTRRVRELGAQGALVVVPPYVKPTPAGMVAHFEAVAAAAPGLAIVPYNVPGRAGANLPPAVLPALWRLPNVVALKESSGDLQQIGRIAAELPRGKVLLAGDDGLAVASIAVGAQGLVSVAGNVVPRLVRDLVAAALAGSAAAAQRLQARLLPLFDALFAEPNPIPVKAALDLVGIAGPMLRLPLQPATGATRDRLAAALRHATAVERKDAEVAHG